MIVYSIKTDLDERAWQQLPFNSAYWGIEIGYHYVSVWQITLLMRYEFDDINSIEVRKWLSIIKSDVRFPLEFNVQTIFQE